MKIKPEHLAELRRLVATYDNNACRQEARSMRWSPARYHYWLCGKPLVLDFICHTLYQYLQDAHIDTAMRRIIPTLDPLEN
jgi:hypothetical protein